MVKDAGHAVNHARGGVSPSVVASKETWMSTTWLTATVIGPDRPETSTLLCALKDRGVPTGV